MSFLKPFRSRNYRLYVTGQVVSMLGFWMHGVASAWLVYRLTGSSAALGGVAFAGQIPLFFFAPFGGVIADAFDRRAVIFRTQLLIMAATFLLAGLTFAGTITVGQIMALSFFMGCVAAVDNPTRQAFVVEMVGKEDLPSAIAINSSMANAMRLLGPMLAGVLIPFVGEGGCFFFHGLGYLSLVFCLTRMRVAPREIVHNKEGILADIVEGFRYAALHPGIRVILLALGGLCLLSVPVSALMPVFVGDVLGGDSASLGLLVSASGVGALAGALSLASRPRNTGILRWVFAAVLLASGGVLLLSRMEELWLAALCLVLVGGGQVVAIASFNTLLQLTTPDAYRGRVMSLFTMMVMGTGPFGALAAGFMAEEWGIPFIYFLCGAGVLVIGALTLPALVRHMRGVG